MRIKISRSSECGCRKKKNREDILRGVTEFLFVSTHICALLWVFTSYGIALYSTIVLGQVYTLEELSKPAIDTILGVAGLKVLGNIFEHNNGGIFGTSDNAGEG